MSRKNLGSHPRTLLDELDSLKAVDGVLHTDQGREIRLGCISEPELPLAELLGRLEMAPPRRLRPPGLNQISPSM